MGTAPSSGTQKGQVVLILLGAIALGLTLGLAVASRSTTDVALSRKIEDSARAFSAAEAGVEEILKTPLNPSQTKQLTFSGAQATIQAVPTPVQGGLFEFPKIVAQGEAQTVWFTNHSTTAPYTIDEASGEAYNGDFIDICWKRQNVSKVPGLEISLTYADLSGGYHVVRRAYRYNSQPGCPSTDGFDCSQVVLANQNDCPGYTYQKRLHFKSSFQDVDLTKNVTKLFMRLRPYYDSVQVAVKAMPNQSIPRQAIVDAVSVGTSVAGGETTKIRVFQGYLAPPPVFDYALYSGQTVTVR